MANANSLLLQKDLVRVLDDLSEIIFVVLADGTLSFISDKCEDIFGYLPEEMVGKNLRDFTAEQSQDYLNKFFEDLNKIQEGGVFKLWQIAKNGNLKYVTGKCIPVYEDGIVTSFEGIFKDMTDSRKSFDEITEKDVKIKKLYDDIEKKNKYMLDFERKKSHFITMINAQVQGPVFEINNSIVFLEELLDKIDDPKQVKSIINLKKNVQRLNKGVIDLLNTGKIELPKVTKRSTVESIIDQQIKMFEHIGMIGSFGILAVSVIDFDEVVRDKDEDEKAYFMSMFKNAVAKALTRHDDVVLGSKDNSVFLFLPNTDKTGAHFVCDKIRTCITENIHNDKGKNYLNVGFGFSKYLTDGNNANSLINAAINSVTRKRKILILDDDIGFSIQIEKVLNQGNNNFECFKIVDGRDIMNIVLDNIPDIIIAEMTAPGMGGYELIGILKINRETKNIPIILLSQYDIENTEMKTLLPNTIPVVNKANGIEGLKELILNNL